MKVAIYCRLPKDKDKRHVTDDSESIQEPEIHADPVCHRTGMGNLWDIQ